jgi:hypothetical protein
MQDVRARIASKPGQRFHRRVESYAAPLAHFQKNAPHLWLVLEKVQRV